MTKPTTMIQLLRCICGGAVNIRRQDYHRRLDWTKYRECRKCKRHYKFQRISYHDPDCVQLKRFRASHKEADRCWSITCLMTRLRTWELHR